MSRADIRSRGDTEVVTPEADSGGVPHHSLAIVDGAAVFDHAENLQPETRARTAKSVAAMCR